MYSTLFVLTWKPDKESRRSRKETPIALDADVSRDLFHSPSLLFAPAGNIVLSKMNSCSKDDAVCLYWIILCFSLNTEICGTTNWQHFLQKPWSIRIPPTCKYLWDFMKSKSLSLSFTLNGNRMPHCTRPSLYFTRHRTWHDTTQAKILLSLKELSTSFSCAILVVCVFFLLYFLMYLKRTQIVVFLNHSKEMIQYVISTDTWKIIKFLPSVRENWIRLPIWTICKLHQIFQS